MRHFWKHLVNMAGARLFCAHVFVLSIINQTINDINTSTSEKIKNLDTKVRLGANHGETDNA